MADDKVKGNFRADALGKLWTCERLAERGGRFSPSDALIAASELRRAWEAANAKGMSLKSFEADVLASLKHEHKRRFKFKKANYSLAPRHEPITADTKKSFYKRVSGNDVWKGPQLGMEPYLVGIEIAARYCGEDTDDWKLRMLMKTAKWALLNRDLEVAEADDRSTENLAIMLATVCREVATKYGLARAHGAIREMSCRWEMFDDKLAPDGAGCLQWTESPISPYFGPGAYFEEAPPYASVPLIRVPYLVTDTHFRLCPEDELCEPDDELLSVGAFLRVGAPVAGGTPGLPNHYNIPPTASGRQQAEGRLIYYREIRLATVPDGRGQFTGALESRPVVTVHLGENTPVPGRHRVHGGYEPTLERGLFYARKNGDKHVFPTIADSSGRRWRVRTAGDESTPIWVRDPANLGWEFDADPIGQPGGYYAEPWYLSYTPATPDYLGFWLTSDWTLHDEPADYPWSAPYDAEARKRWEKGVPPSYERNFSDDRSAAASIECCLFNGLIQEALEAAAENLATQAARLQIERRRSIDSHVQEFLKGFKHVGPGRENQ